MARDAYRASTGELGRGERWDRERFSYERDRDRYGDERVRYEEDDQAYTRDARGPPPRGPIRREDDFVRDRRYYDDYPRRPSSPPTAEFQRKVVIEKERTRSPSPPPRPRPGMLRRQSSLDTFDRRPPTRFYEREEYGPPARRDDYRPPPNVPIPLPVARGLPPPRRYAERAYEEERFEDDYRTGGPFPERVREREIIRTRQRDRSRESRSTRSHSHHRGSTVRGRSRSSSTSSRSSSSSGGTTVKSEYPKKGKTRIPGRLVSKRALFDLGYPWIEEGSTIIVQKALSEEQIDDLLKLSENYKKNEAEMSGARPAPPRETEIIEERREEVVIGPGAGPRPFHHPPPPVLHTARPVAEVDIVRSSTVIRDVSPARSTTTASSYGPVVVDARPREYSEEVAVGPLALVTQDHHHRHHHHSHSRHRSHSRGDRVLRAEIRDVERRGWGGGEVVAAERLSNGELVLYEEKIERIEEPRRGVRIEKDKKGRMSISVPKKR